METIGILEQQSRPFFFSFFFIRSEKWNWVTQGRGISIFLCVSARLHHPCRKQSVRERNRETLRCRIVRREKARGERSADTKIRPVDEIRHRHKHTYCTCTCNIIHPDTSGGGVGGAFVLSSYGYTHTPHIMRHTWPVRSAKTPSAGEYPKPSKGQLAPHQY